MGPRKLLILEARRQPTSRLQHWRLTLYSLNVLLILLPSHERKYLFFFLFYLFLARIILGFHRQARRRNFSYKNGGHVVVAMSRHMIVCAILNLSKYPSITNLKMAVKMIKKKNRFRFVLFVDCAKFSLVVFRQK